MLAGVTLAIAACSSPEDEQVATTTTSIAPATTTTTLPPSTTPPEVSTEVTTTTTLVPATTFVDLEYERNESYYFTSPDGQFQCGIIKLPNRTEAGCQGETSPIPPQPEDCLISWGSGIRVDNTGPGAFMCAGGLLYTSGDPEPDPVLPPGSVLSQLGYTCATTEINVTCSNDETTHGFTIAANSNRTF
ncbi:MAG: hypothetical protein GX542_04025 [Rhodococcus sp.]|nr:hypothetical protein [Rhodococcus sp. (in: high G+C Gram-positive bacteria)]